MTRRLLLLLFLSAVFFAPSNEIVAEEFGVGSDVAADDGAGSDAEAETASPDSREGWPMMRSVVDIGARMRFSWNFTPLSLSAPLVAGSVFASERFSLSLAAVLDWGFGAPADPGLAYFDFLAGMSFIYFPFRDILSLRAAYFLSGGLAILNNCGHVMDADLCLDIPVGRGYRVSLSGGVFWRAYFPVIGYLGSAAFYGSGAGICFQAALRWRGLLPHYPLP